MLGELEESKEEIHYLKNKLNQKYTLVEDLKHDLDRNEEKFKETKKELSLTEEKLNALENLVAEQVEEINILRDNNQSMISQISENVMMEKKINVQNAVIKELKDKVKEKNEFKNEEKEFMKLVDDIEHLKGVNEEKEIQLENISKENELLKVKLDRLEAIESENVVLKGHLDKNADVDKNNELDSHFSRNFKCKECDEHFGNRRDFEHHKRNVHTMHGMKMRLHELEIRILEQKFDVSVKISKLKEAEHTCHCAGWCAINHLKHSWKKSSSKNLCSKFQKIADECPPKEMYTRNICEDKFTNVNHLETHMPIHENVYHECESCRETFPNANDFVFHMEHSHKEANVMFLC